MTKRFAAALLLASVAAPAAAGTVSHGLSLIGDLKYPAGFAHLDYVNPDAPKGGTLRRHAIGTFDTFNPFIIKGSAASGIGLIHETLMTSPADEAPAEYGLVAKTVEVPDDLSHVVFELRPEAKFHDGTPVTADDVIWTFETLKEKGAPIYPFYYKNVARGVKLGDRRVKFEFAGPPNRELPQITGQLPVLSKAWWSTREVELDVGLRCCLTVLQITPQGYKMKAPIIVFIWISSCQLQLRQGNNKI